MPAKGQLKFRTISDLINAKAIKLENGCLVWTGKINEKGYGAVKREGKTWRAHRLSYLDFYGHLDKNLTIDHLCKNRSCVNPLHLEQVTQRENVYRGNGLAAVARLKTRCLRGHEFNAGNTKIYKKNPTHRICVICKRFRQKRNRANKVQSLPENRRPTKNSEPVAKKTLGSNQ